MKKILLLAAIYSLIIHQSHKNRNTKAFLEEQKIKVTKTEPLQDGFYQRYTNSINSDYKYASFISDNIQAKQNEKE